MDAKVQAFLNEWNGKIIPFVNVPTGSCMAVAHQFILEVFGITDPLIIFGEFAYMVYTNFANLPAANYFTLVANTETNVPSSGDIPIFGQTADTPEGHICVFVSGDVNSFQSIDQNYPTGSAVHLQTHTYTGLLGWLHFNNPVESPTQNVTITDQQVTDQLNAEIQALNSCQMQLKEASAQNVTLQSQLTSLQDQLKSSQESLNAANTQITTLQTQLSGEQKEIVNLNTTIEQQASSNKDYATEIYTLSHANTALTNSLNSIVDGLGVIRGAQTLDQITSASLSKEDELDMLLKAAGVVEGLVHNMAATLKLDDPNATDQQVANNIVSYVKSLQGRLQSIMPNKSEDGVITTGENLWSRFVGWFWQST